MIKVGDIVNHRTFGNGIVQEILTIEEIEYAKILLFKRYESPFINMFKDSVQVVPRNLTPIKY